MRFVRMPLCNLALHAVGRSWTLDLQNCLNSLEENQCGPYVVDSASVIDRTIGTNKYGFTASILCVACV
jgi:hypothetical protein